MIRARPRRYINSSSTDKARDGKRILFAVRRLSAAEYCERTSGRRMIRLADFFRKDRKNLRCARCGKSTAWGCASCGVALCLVPRSSRANHSAVSCMDVAHIRWKYDIDSGAVMKNRGE